MEEKAYYNSLPKKRIAIGAILFNASQDILILKPNYHTDWLLPGGVVEESESPLAGHIREIREELGIIIDDLTFLCVDYTPAEENKPDGLKFLFVGSLSASQIAELTLNNNEHEEYKFVSSSEAIKLLNKKTAARLPEALVAYKESRGVYLEQGKVA